MIDDNMGRTWSNAPVGVRNVRALAILGVLGSGVTLLIALMILRW